LGKISRTIVYQRETLSMQVGTRPGVVSETDACNDVCHRATKHHWVTSRA